MQHARASACLNSSGNLTARYAIRYAIPPPKPEINLSAALKGSDKAGQLNSIVTVI